jgi:adenylylsulfate kinase
VRSLFRKDQFYEIYLECPWTSVAARPEGLYRKAREGLIPAFTGITDPYEPPLAPDLIVRTADLSIEESLKLLLEFTLEHCAARRAT